MSTMETAYLPPNYYNEIDPDAIICDECSEPVDPDCYATLDGVTLCEECADEMVRRNRVTICG